jgi:FkbM family methyltransferase
MFIRIKGLIPRKLKTFLKKFFNFNGYLGLDKKMREFISYKSGFYIECGANNGVDQSNTWYYEKKLGWSGILIEPQKNVFKELKKNRSKKNFFENCALKSVTQSNFKVLYACPSDTLITRSSKNSSRYVKKFTIKAKTLHSILQKYRAPSRIDFFSLDVEGDELNVLNGINFSKYIFSNILVETMQFKKINFFLKKRGYIFKKKLSDGDYLFQKK